MRRSKSTHKHALPVLIAAAFACAHAGKDAHAQTPVPLIDNTVHADSDSFKPFVEDAVTYDSNLYRLPPDAAVATLVSPNASREDEINSASAGLDGVWLYGAQEVDLDMRVDDNEFAHNHNLDNVSTSDKVLWKWSVGSQLTGNADVDFNRGLATYGETLYLGKDFVDTADYFGNARYQFGPHWAVFGGVRESDTTHSAPAAKYNDDHVETGDAGIEYAVGMDDSVGVEYLFINSGFPQDFLYDGTEFDRNFKEDRQLFLIQYTISSKTVLNANAGFVQRHYDTEGFANFSGVIGRGSLQWNLTDKTQLLFAAWRDLESYLSSTSDFFVANGASVSPSWQATEKISLSLYASYQDMRYISSSVSAETSGPRHDKLSTEQASLSYTPFRALIFNFSFANTQRDSNQALFVYNDKLARASVSFKF
jgi:exopolysaccharide biosynthesis operon protein EpsL